MISIVLCVTANAKHIDALTPDMTLVNQEEQNYNLTKDITIIVGIQVPPAVVAGNQSADYSQFAFMGQAFVDEGCSIMYQDSTNSKTYAVQKEYSDAYFAVELCKQQNVNIEFIYLNVRSTCDLQLRLVAVAVHQLDAHAISLTKSQPQNTYFVHKHVPGVRKQGIFDINSPRMAEICIGSAPKLLNIMCADCRLELKTQPILEFEIEVDIHNNSLDYIYYSISQPGSPDFLISADIADVQKLDLKEKQQLLLEHANPLHFELSYDNKHKSLNVIQIENVTLCFTDQISFSRTDCSISIKKAGKYDITPEMVHSLLVYTDLATGIVELVISPKQSEKQSHLWIIWVVLGVVVIVVLILAFVFFFMRYKKQKQSLDNEQMPLYVK
ncbi:Conserved_hypothetical protein [Hexamita inflata]|uniref:Uncharacterized protein n=1 Tax=Hexamita inflata TaxID=28002 RepID=A0AA86PN70_9EUKA|nr:Conserved hypothetical protein [Hexamita inflata]